MMNWVAPLEKDTAAAAKRENKIQNLRRTRNLLLLLRLLSGQIELGDVG